MNYKLYREGTRIRARLQSAITEKDLIKQVFHEPHFDFNETRMWSIPLDKGSSIFPRNWNRLMYHSGKRNPYVFHAPANVPAPNSVSLMPHQQDIYEHILTNKQVVIAAEPRTGKTLPTLKACEQIGGPVVWVTTVSGEVSTRNELLKWYDGRPPFKIEIYTYERFSRLWPNGWDKEHLPRVVVLDEVHKVKSSESNMGMTCLSVYNILDEAFEGDFYLISMTGTPAPHSPLDWWHVLEVTRPGYLPEKSKQALLERLAVTIECENDYGITYKKLDSWKEWAIKEFYEELAHKPDRPGMALMVFKKEVLGLPDKVHEFVHLPMSEETSIAVEIAKQTCRGAAILAQRLLQISDGFVYVKTDGGVDEEDSLLRGKHGREAALVPTPKIDQLEEDAIREERAGNWRLVVFAGYQESIDLVTNRLLKLGWGVLRADGRGWKVLGVPSNKDKVLTAFDRSRQDDPNAKALAGVKLALVGNPKTCSTGIELSMAPLLIYYGHTTNGVDEFQSVERAHSMNMDKERGLTVRHYCHLPTDEKLFQALIEKKELQALTMGDLYGDMAKL